MPELNGTDVLLLARTSTGPDVYAVVGSQRNVTFNETTAAIDMSSKASRAYKGAPGRYNCTASLEHLYVPGDSAYAALRAAMRNGTTIRVRRQESGSDVEQADAIVTSLSEAMPDQAECVVSCELQVTGEWGAIA